MRILLSLTLTVALAGCDEVDLERMIDQPSYRPFEANPRFDDGMAMRRPPPGTVPRSAVVGPAELVSGRDDEGWLADFPLEVDRALVDRGRDRFRIFCAVCHGARGDGVSQVAENMDLRPPPSLVDPPYRDYPPGRIFAVATEGYGLMPSYREELTVHDRWAVTAFVQVLALSQRARLDELPDPLREEASEWLP